MKRSRKSDTRQACLKRLNSWAKGEDYPKISNGESDQDTLSDVASPAYDHEYYCGQESVIDFFRSEAKSVLSKSQIIFFIAFGAVSTYLFCFYTQDYLDIISTISGCIFMSSSCFKLMVLILKSRCKKTKTKILQKIPDFSNLPNYSIMVPLFKESEVIEQLVKNISNINYPKEKMQALLVIENDDEITLNSIKSTSIPHYFTVIRVPYSEPRTKAKACNYAMKFVTGQYMCIYDAEDEPDPDQLLRVLDVFENDDKCSCIQSKLNFYNAGENILTKMFSIEYSFIFDYMLPVLQNLSHPIPLGGSSNHFRTDILKKIMWDAYNLTEDADLGMQMKKNGHKICIVDSYTLEEAPITFKAWYRQRSRWIKGYTQTYFVHSRSFLKLMKKFGLGGSFSFHCILLFGNLSLLMSLILVATTISLEISQKVKVFLGINGVLWYIISFAQGFLIQEKKFFSMRYKRITSGILFPLYTISQIFPCIKALVQLIIKPHYWEKTDHGVSKIRNTRRK